VGGLILRAGGGDNNPSLPINKRDGADSWEDTAIHRASGEDSVIQPTKRGKESGGRKRAKRVPRWLNYIDKEME